MDVRQPYRKPALYGRARGLFSSSYIHNVVKSGQEVLENLDRIIENEEIDKVKGMTSDQPKLRSFSCSSGVRAANS